MKRKIVNMGTIGIVVIILLVGVLNYKQAAETKMKKIETEEKYSLQGTTQGNGLTGGAPPVRFSM